MRLGLVSRTGLIVVAGITVAWLGQVVLFSLAVRREGRHAWMPPRQVAALVELIEAGTPGERELVLRAVSSPVLRASLLETLELGETSPRRVPRRTARQLEEALGALGGRPVSVALRDERWRGGRWFASPTDLELRVGLATGETLVVRMQTTPVSTLLGLPIGFAVGLFGAAVGLVALVVIHRETRPLVDLVAAVGRLDLTGSPALLPSPPGAAPEIRGLVAAFNGLLGRLAELLRARLALLGGISHDVRTFATRLRLRLEQIPGDEERRRAAADIDDMIRLLDGALLASRAGAGELAEELLDLGELAAAVVEDRRARGDAVRVAAGDTGAGPLRVLGDRLALRRVVANLLDNATTHGTHAILTLGGDRDEVWLGVADDGPGIPPDRREAALEPFVRLGASETRSTGGEGLGLAVVRTVVDGHRGRVRIGDAPGGGALVEVRLPRFRDAPPIAND